MKFCQLLLIRRSTAAQARLSEPNRRITLHDVLHVLRRECAISWAVVGADLGAIMDHVGWKTSSSAHHYIKLDPVLHPCGVSDTLAGISSDFMERSWVLPKPSLLCTALFSY